MRFNFRATPWRRHEEHVELSAIAIGGTIGKGAQIVYDHGIDAFVSILQTPCTLDEAIEQASELETVCTEDVMRLVVMGRSMIPGLARTDETRRLAVGSVSPDG